MDVVVGASGQTGSVVMNALLKSGKTVRAVVRSEKQAESWRARGAEAALADVGDTAALVGAFTGARSAYLMNPPAYGDPDMFARARTVHTALIEAARLAGVGHIVALSSVGGQHAAGTGNILTTHDFETRLAEYPGAVTILRAANFIENWGMVLNRAKKDAVLPSMFLPLDRRIPMVSVSDIGTVAAELLGEPARSRRRLIELHGPADYSADDAAAALSVQLGYLVHSIEVPEDAWPAIFAGFRFPPVTVAAFCEMFAGFNSGHIAFEGSHETRRGATTLGTALARMLAA